MWSATARRSSSARRCRGCTGRWRAASCGACGPGLSDLQTFKDLVWHVLLLGIGIADFTIAVTAWAHDAGPAHAPAWWWSIPRTRARWTSGLFHVHDWGTAFLAMGLGLVALPVAAALVRGTALGSALLGRALLGADRAALEARVSRLAETREGAVSAAAGSSSAWSATSTTARRRGSSPSRWSSAWPRSSSPRRRRRRRARAGDGGPGRDAPGAGRAARPRARHAPRAAGRARPGGGAEVAGRAQPRARRRARGAARPSPGDGRVRGLLRRRRGAGQRRQARRGDPHDDRGDRGPRPGRGARRRRRRGGADPGGRGPDGLRKRVEALDGTLAITSPSGAGTHVRAELPCAW